MKCGNCQKYNAAGSIIELSDTSDAAAAHLYEDK
jgi:hypothetical protein